MAEWSGTQNSSDFQPKVSIIQIIFHNGCHFEKQNGGHLVFGTFENQTWLVKSLVLENRTKWQPSCCWTIGKPNFKMFGIPYVFGIPMFGIGAPLYWCFYLNTDLFLFSGIYFAEHSSKSNQYIYGIGGGTGCPTHKDRSCYTCHRWVQIGMLCHSFGPLGGE